MLYAANIDGHIHEDELEVILEKTDKTVLEKMKKQFPKMSDSELLNFLSEYKDSYLSTPEDRRQMLDDIHGVFSVDEHCSTMERHLFRVIDKLLK